MSTNSITEKTTVQVGPCTASSASLLTGVLSNSQNAGKVDMWVPMVVAQVGAPSSTPKVQRKVTTAAERKDMKPSLPPEDSWVTELLED